MGHNRGGPCIQAVLEAPPIFSYSCSVGFSTCLGFWRKEKAMPERAFSCLQHLWVGRLHFRALA